MAEATGSTGKISFVGSINSPCNATPSKSKLS